MTLFRESWPVCLAVYAVGACFAFPALRPPTPIVVVLVLLTCLIHSHQAIRHSARTGITIVCATLQLAAVAVVGSANMRWVRLDTVSWLAVAALLGAAVLAALLAERANPEWEPRYSVEAVIVALFSVGYLTALSSSSVVSHLIALVMVHAGILSMAVERNRRLECEHVSGPVTEGGYVVETWHVRVREPGGIQGVTAALALPSGILGSVLVLTELVVLGVVWIG